MSEKLLLQILDEVIGVKDRLTSLETEVSTFRNEMKEFKTEMIEFKSEMNEFKTEMNEFKTEMKVFQNEVKEFQTEVRTDLQILKGGQKGIRAEISERFMEVKREQNNHDYAIDVLHRNQLRLETELEKLKNK